MSFVDPLWEYVLEDYEDEESYRRDFFGRSKRADSKPRGFISNLGSKNRTEYRDEEEDGIWDVISGAPPAATIPKRSKSNKGRSLLSTKSSSNTNRNISPPQSQLNHSERESNISEKKKKVFKRRFSWNPNSKSTEDVSMKRDLNKTLTDGRESSKRHAEREGNDSAFDPMDLLFHIADTLDPWGIDPSESSASDTDSQETVDDEVDGALHMTDQFADEITERQPSKATSKNSKSQGTKNENGCTTEIRLRVNRENTLSEEVYQTSTNKEQKSERNIRTSSRWDEERYPRRRSSFDPDVLKPNQKVERKSKQSNLISKGKRCTPNRERKTSGMEERVPTNVHISERSDPDIRDDSGEDVGKSKASKSFSKVICGSKNNDKNDCLRRSDGKEVFPSSRVMINGETHVVTSPESDPINGMMGVPSSALIGSKGPQSVFAYDYGSNTNMDVSYTKPNQKPRTYVSVRKLGAPPTSSLLGSEQIVIQIEASLVSETDCIIRQGLWWGGSQPSFPITPGINIVGKVHSVKQTTGKAYSVKPMQTVMSLVKWGGNARFTTIHPKQLVTVPEGLDPAEVACLPECYLSAFQVLHMGQTGNNRYKESSLKGKSILILGSMTNNMGKAIIELALQAGVANIYATAKKKHWKTLISYGVMPLTTDPMEYIQRIAGTIDLVLAPNGNLREDVTPVHFKALLPRYGQLIISGHRIIGNDIPINAWKRDSQIPTLACGKNKALQKILRNSQSYDVYKAWEKNLDLCKRDLSHLLTLLERKLIKPEVLDRIPLNKVAKAHELLETKRLPGFLVCEPWMKNKKHAVYL